MTNPAPTQPPAIDATASTAKAQALAAAVLELPTAERIVIDRILDWMLTTAETIDALAKAVGCLNELDDVRAGEIAALHRVVALLSEHVLRDVDGTHSVRVDQP